MRPFMPFEEICQTFIKWFLPIFFAGTAGVAIKAMFDTYSKGRRQRQQEDWDARAKKLIEKVDFIKQESDEHDIKLDKHMSEIDSTLSIVLRSSKMQTYRNIQHEGRELLNKDYISDVEYQQFEEEYSIYKESGGDGWADDIYEAIKKLHTKSLMNEKNRGTDI